MKLLTVAIPTYNGVKKVSPLLISLERARNQIAEELDIVNFILVDNGSTQSYIEILSSYKWINYYRNTKNIGADANFLRCVELSQSEYVWMIGDDDYITDDSLKQILDFLKKFKPNGLFINFSLSAPVVGEFFKKKWINVDSDYFFDDSYDFFSLVGNSFNFLSASIHKTDLFLSSSPKKWIGTNWIQYAAFLFATVNGKIGLINQALVVNAGDSTLSEGNIDGAALRIIFNMCDIIEHFDCNMKLKRLLLDDVAKYIPRKIMSSKYRGLKDAKKFHHYIIKYSGTSLKLIFNMLLLHMPLFLVRLGYFLYRQFSLNRVYWRYC